MTASMSCRLIGRWRIVEADIWDRDYPDLVEPAMMIIAADGHGEIAFGAMQAALDLEYAHALVFFTREGFDEMDEVHGSGSAELLDDGTLEIEFAYHLGDEATLKAERVTSSTACWWVTGGEAADSPHFPLLLDLGLDIPPSAAMGDKGYDARANRDAARARGICPVIPYKSNAKVPPCFFPKALYRGRARIEQTVGKIKRFKRIALRCGKTATNFAAFVALALGFILVKSTHTA